MVRAQPKGQQAADSSWVTLARTRCGWKCFGREPQTLLPSDALLAELGCSPRVALGHVLPPRPAPRLNCDSGHTSSVQG